MAIGANCSDGHATHDKDCPACLDVVIRKLRRDLGSSRAAMRGIADLARDGSELGHNNYVAIFQAAMAVIREER